MGAMEPLHSRPGYLTAHQAAAQLGITLSGLRDLVHRGHLRRAPGSTPRQAWYDTDEVCALAAQRSTAAA
jgi:hypothetical protein